MHNNCCVPVPQSYKARFLKEAGVRGAANSQEAFELLPSRDDGPAYRSFSFNLAGSDVKIASLTCRHAPARSRLPTHSPSPPWPCHSSTMTGRA